MISCIYLSKIGKSYIIADSQTYFTVWCFYHRKRITGSKCVRFFECNLKKNKKCCIQLFNFLLRRSHILEEAKSVLAPSIRWRWIFIQSDFITKYIYSPTLFGILISKRCILRNFPIISPFGDHAVVVLKSFSVPSIISRSGKDPPIK